MKENILSKIERLCNAGLNNSTISKKDVLKTILAVINSIPSEQPQGLDEAAEEYARTKHTDKTLQRIVSWDFKAGAKWMAEQGGKSTKLNLKPT